MTFTSTINGFVDTGNTNTSLNQKAWNLTSGLIVSSSTTETTGSFVIDTGSGVDDTYNDLVIEITSGVGLNRSYLITDYTVTAGPTRTCEIAGFIEILPDSTSTYIIHTYSGKCQTQDQDNQFKTAKLSLNLSSQDNFHNQCFVKFLTSNGTGQLRRIINYNGTSKVISIDNDLITPIDNTTLFVIIGISGTSQTGTSSTIQLQNGHGHSTVDDFYNNFYIEIYSGTGSGQTRMISDYTGATITCTVSTWDTNPDSTSVYNIYSGWGASSFSDSSKISQTTLSLSSETSERSVIYQQLGLTNDDLNNRVKYIENSSITPSSEHTLVVASNYYKLKIVTIGTTLNGAIQTIFHNAKNKALTSFIEEPINKNNDCELTKSVITGKTFSGLYKNVNVSNTGNLNAEIVNPTTAFGELQTSNLIPVVQINFPYYKNTELITEFYNSGTVVTMVTEGTAGTPQVQYIYTPTASLLVATANPSNYFFIYSGGGSQFYVWYEVDITSTDPSPGGTGIQVTVSSSDTAVQVATATVTAVDANGNFGAVALLGNLIQITNAANGNVTSIQTETMPTSTTSAITYNKSESTLSLTNEVGIGTYAVMTSSRVQKYRPGQGGIGRLTAIFDTPTVGIQQTAGIGNQVSGFFFGVNPADGNFGILHRKSGLASVQILTITNGATGSETATITVDGIDFPVPLVSGTTNETCYQIANSQNIFKPGQWLVDQINSTVIFLSETATGSRSKTYAFSSTGGAVGTWSTETAGTAVDNTWISQDNWNLNKLNGYETTSMHLNPTKGNVYQIQYQCLGFGTIKFSIEDNNTGAFIPVHEIGYANKNIVPSVSQPAMKLLWGVNTTVNTSSATMKMASGSLFNEGEIRDLDNTFSNTISLTTTGSTEEHLITYGNRRTFYGKGNNSVIKPKYLNFSNDANKGGVIRIYLNSTIADYNYEYIDENRSVGVSDTSGTLTGGTLVFSFGIAGDSDEQINVKEFENLILQPNQTLSFTIQRSTTTNIEITSVLVWHEDQ